MRWFMSVLGSARMTPALRRRHRRLISMALGAALVGGCATGAYRQGERAARAGDWDAAVESYRRALQDDPRRADYRIAFERAKLSASTAHLDAARELEARDQLSAALLEYQKAREYDPSNGRTLERLVSIDRAIREPPDAARPRPDVGPETSREQAPALLPLASREPLRLRFTNASLKDILDFLAEAGGINLIYDPQFQDRTYSVDLDGVTIEEALDLILTANQHFYQVLNRRTIVITPDTPLGAAPMSPGL